MSSKVTVVQEFREADRQMLRSVFAQTNPAPPNWKRRFLLIILLLNPPITSSKFGQNQEQLNSIY